MRVNRTVAKHRHVLVDCPFCGKELLVKVTVGFVNNHAPQYKRVTGANVRRTPATSHECVDPTVPR